MKINEINIAIAETQGYIDIIEQHPEPLRAIDNGKAGETAMLA